MKICPIAIAVGCAKCPVFSVCPVKRLIGDQPAKDAPPAARASVSTRSAKPPRQAKSARPAAAAKRAKPARPTAARKKTN